MTRLSLLSPECYNFLAYAKAKSIELNHHNFTDVIKYVLQEEPYSVKLVYEKYKCTKSEIQTELGEMVMSAPSYYIEFDSQYEVTCFLLRWS